MNGFLLLREFPEFVFIIISYYLNYLTKTFLKTLSLYIKNKHKKNTQIYDLWIFLKHTFIYIFF
jgi:hypothetical protein